jgi:SpoVK/Ycf46/Vps4 family AAA+-type ATPase
MVPVGPPMVRSPARGTAIYLLSSAGLVLLYVLIVTLLWVNRGFEAEGPLGFNEPQATAALDPGVSLATIEQQCVNAGDFVSLDGDTIKVVATRIASRAYYACYQLNNGSVYDAVVVDDKGLEAPDRIAKQYGAWPWIGLVKSPTELVLGAAALIALFVLYFSYYRRNRPGAPYPGRWWQTSVAALALGLVLVLPLTLPFRRGESRERRMRLLYEFGFGLVTLVLVTFFFMGFGDLISSAVIGLLIAGTLFGWVGGRLLLAPNGFGSPDRVGSPIPGQSTAPPGVRPEVRYESRPELQLGAQPLAQPGSQGSLPAAVSGPKGFSSTAKSRTQAARPAYLRPPSGLPTFADVGGMDALKAELADTFGLLLAFGDEADTYRITFNGMLLHGPPGVGKTFIAKAVAGEFGLSFAHVATGDLISKFIGESSANIRKVFAETAQHVPAVLFFDEFDSIAERRSAGIDEESKRVVNQLLQSLEEWRSVRDLVIMAATNHVENLDPAVVRPGRFDRHIRVDLPDLPARRAILAAQLAGRPISDDIDLADLAERTAGRTPANLTRMVEAAALSAFRAATESGSSTPIAHLDLRKALTGMGGTDRPMVEDWSWDRLILAEATKGELKQVQALVADPDLAKAYGVDVPSGLLLAGPPGTGKTTIARVLAAQTGFSFYSRTAADLTSKWVGESEASVARLFARARDNAPSIIFIDEIDAIGGARSDLGSSAMDRTLTQLLTEIDGLIKQPGVFVVGATNRPEMLDPALLRGGRLSRTITVPLPEIGDRRRLLDVFTARMPLHDVDLDRLAGQTAGYSGADLEALCQQAAINSMLAAKGAEAEGPSLVTAAAFALALRDRTRAAGPKPLSPDEPTGTGGYL